MSNIQDQYPNSSEIANLTDFTGTNDAFIPAQEAPLPAQRLSLTELINRVITALGNNFVTLNPQGVIPDGLVVHPDSPIEFVALLADLPAAGDPTKVYIVLDTTAIYVYQGGGWLPIGTTGTPTTPTPDVYVFTTAATPWNVNHNKGYKPLVQILDDSNNSLAATIHHTDDNNIVITPSVPSTGSVLVY